MRTHAVGAAAATRQQQRAARPPAGLRCRPGLLKLSRSLRLAAAASRTSDNVARRLSLCPKAKPSAGLKMADRAGWRHVMRLGVRPAVAISHAATTRRLSCCQGLHGAGRHAPCGRQCTHGWSSCYALQPTPTREADTGLGPAFGCSVRRQAQHGSQAMLKKAHRLIGGDPWHSNVLNVERCALPAVLRPQGLCRAVLALGVPLPASQPPTALRFDVLEQTRT